MLGAHPEVIPPSRLVRAAAYFDVPDTAVRVALTRAVATGDLRRTEAGYALGDRLLKRQQRQQEAVAAVPTPWAGEWEQAVVVVAGRSGPDRAALRALLAEYRLAELREGVWLRPANLARAPAYADRDDLIVLRSWYSDSAALARRLWDLEAWAETGRRLHRDLTEAEHLAERLAIAAELVRHLSTDPILPEDVLPANWPGADLRSGYASFQQELRDLAAHL